MDFHLFLFSTEAAVVASGFLLLLLVVVVCVCVCACACVCVCVCVCVCFTFSLKWITLSDNHLSEGSSFVNTFF